MTNITQSQVDYIMENFDFERVHRVMVSLDWKWLGLIPTLEQIKTQAQDLMMEFIDNSVDIDGERFISRGTGGFMARLSGTDYSTLSLEFAVETRYAYPRDNSYAES